MWETPMFLPEICKITWACPRPDWWYDTMIQLFICTSNPFGTSRWPTTQASVAIYETPSSTRRWEQKGLIPRISLFSGGVSWFSGSCVSALPLWTRAASFQEYTQNLQRNATSTFTLSMQNVKFWLQGLFLSRRRYGEPGDMAFFHVTADRSCMTDESEQSRALEYKASVQGHPHNCEQIVQASFRSLQCDVCCARPKRKAVVIVLSFISCEEMMIRGKPLAISSGIPCTQMKDVQVATIVWRTYPNKSPQKQQDAAPQMTLSAILWRPSGSWLCQSICAQSDALRLSSAANLWKSYSAMNIE